ncbi:nuclear transport factor 2 family protein [Pseudidiomarina gelatinasegens]|uniref:Nuclear transport factor 2 family protein n=1 Tax=Pseudidiomarina gelatinasegens TaxID=2487740 RepID=A0A443YZ60_9GAMM|nr:nuclear transport factor 2 family protein [Pseudidiomarina gelatinasegens]RWU09495.1 nuclear transport factor 2 family protein [Pseudidiomarina gelatinasegens]
MQPIETMIRRFSSAWATFDTDVILDAVTDDFRFGMANSDEVIKGKTAFADWLHKMGSGDGGKATITHRQFLLDGDRAVLTGDLEITCELGTERLAFCDVYELNGSKIKGLTAYLAKYGETIACPA